MRPRPANTAPLAVASTRGSEADHPPSRAGGSLRSSPATRRAKRGYQDFPPERQESFRQRPQRATAHARGIGRCDSARSSRHADQLYLATITLILCILFILSPDDPVSATQSACS
jgi:hypothetical protein